MNIAEGKGPKQTKKTWPLGQFVTNYGNDGTPGSVYPPAVAYAAQITSSGVGYTTSSGKIGYAQPGSLNPGLNLNVNGNGAIDVSFVCAPDNNVSLQDVQSLTTVLSAETSWSGTATVAIQGTFDRFTPNAYYNSNATLYNSTNWTTIATGSVTTASVPVLLKVPVASGIFYNAYRVVASGATASGIIDWTLPGMFLDLSAQQIGKEATWVNGSIGQQNLNDVDSITISGVTVTGYTEGTTPNSSISNNHDYIG